MNTIHRYFYAVILIGALLLSSCVRPASKAPPASPIPTVGSSNSTPTFPLPGPGSQATLSSLATQASGLAAGSQITEIPVQTQPATATATATPSPNIFAGKTAYFPLIFMNAISPSQ